ncbi:polysaccharide biosynthesis C-terminal domain-containing protein [Ferruginibacter paludis]|uniref:lipopolysaccharide biosynthesis protein n=1 Tax=Ferruginibacter paludis TaxID=1310417 RepID=UPI0025B300AE|nr:polysaccharide biosynthesis C-terminal domain-containing protein [Ferruginibacter paludis]MDN3658344.1 polysaccharide biosynthesis C-terminal domain-containing protein [Ferruginibacter paludis]
MAVSGYFNELKRKPGLQSAGVYTFTNFFTKGISFLLIPVFTNPRFLTPADNGMLSLFSSSVLFLMPFISLGLTQSASTDFFKLDKTDFKDFFTTGFALTITTTLLAIGIIFLLQDYLHATYGLPVIFVWIVPAVTFLNFCSEQTTGLIRNNDQPFRYLAIGICKTVVELGVALMLIVAFQYGWLGRITGMMTALILISGYSLYYFIKNGYLFGKVKLRYIRAELLYAFPIIVMQANMFIMSSSDKFFLANDHTLLGVYTIACTFASVIVIFSAALIQYFSPKIFALLSADKIKYNEIKKLLLNYAGAMFGSFILFLLFTALFYRLFINVKYHEALHYIYFIAAGYFFWTLASILYSFFLFYKEKKKIIVHSFLSMTVALAANYFFIKRWSAYGAAMAVMVSYFFVLLITIVSTKKYISAIFKKQVAG